MRILIKSQLIESYFFRNNFTFNEITVLDLNPDYNAASMRMYDGNPYPFGLDPVSFIFTLNLPLARHGTNFKL